MAKIDFDADFLDAANRAPSDPDAAAKALLIVAARLREGYVSKGSDYARYLADAIEASMSKPREKRGRALLLELHLAAENRRPASDQYAVGAALEALQGNELSQRARVWTVAKQFQISTATVIRSWKKYREGVAETLRVNRENDGK